MASARSSPLAPEAVERLMRARRGVVPTRASVSSTGYAAATGRSEEQPQPQQPRQQQQQPQSPHPGTRPSGTRAFPAESSFAGARILRRPVSADRASARYPDQQQQQFQQQQRRVSSTGVLSARSQGGMSGGGGGPSGRLSGGPSTSSSTLLAAHRRSKSVDAASLRGRGTSGGGGAGVGSGGGGGGGRVGSASTGRALPLQRRSPPGSPYKVRISTSQLTRHHLRPLPPFAELELSKRRAGKLDLHSFSFTACRVQQDCCSSLNGWAAQGAVCLASMSCITAPRVRRLARELSRGSAARLLSTRAGVTVAHVPN
ncbi:hypothetical protein PLESTM_001711600 [Pleodorina starrii]|nr:hypothetical protein PLESTM_001711600 [Pleodorina starrii]